MRVLFILLATCFVGLSQPMIFMPDNSRYQVSDPYSTATLYVDYAGTNGVGTSWATAKTNLANALAIASDGSVIEVSGGSSGHTYVEAIDTSKAVTIQGSLAAGKNGAVSFDGERRLRALTAGLTGTLRNLTLAFSQANNTTNKVHIYFYPASRWDLKDINITDASEATTTSHPTFHGGIHTFTRVYFANNYCRSAATPIVLYATDNPSTNTFNYCIWDYAGGTIQIANTGVVDTFNNCMFNSCYIPFSSSTPAISQTINDTNTPIYLNNCWFSGQRAVSSTANAIIKATNCFYVSAYMTPGSPNFDVNNRITPVNSITYPTLPKLQSQGNGMGRYFVRLDDTDIAYNVTNAMATLNPEVKISWAVYWHSVYGLNFALSNLMSIRNFLEAGNDVGAHTANHANIRDFRSLQISSTGTSPKLSINCTNSGDSSTWSGVLTATVNSVDWVVDLSNPTNRTLAGLIANLNGRSVGNGTISCSLFSVTGGHSTLDPSMALTNLSQVSISSAFVITNAVAPYMQVQATEAIADLQAYIKTGSDRNGANTLTNAAAFGSVSSNYVCKWVATPYGLGGPEFLAAVQSAGMKGCNICGQSSYLARDGYYMGQPFSIFDMEFNQGPSYTNMWTSAVGAAYGPLLFFHLEHGYPVYDDGLGGGATLAKFKTLMTSFGLGGVTFSQWLDSIYSDPNYTVSGTNCTFTGTVRPYLYLTDKRPAQWSPLRRAGVNMGLLSDFSLMNVQPNISPDIGAYQR